jgi:hypothetical protein
MLIDKGAHWLCHIAECVSTMTSLNSPTTTLLREYELPPVEIVNEHGRADYVRVCEHAGNAIPQRLDQLGLSHDDWHNGWDIRAGALTRGLSRPSCPMPAQHIVGMMDVASYRRRLSPSRHNDPTPNEPREP